MPVLEARYHFQRGPRDTILLYLLTCKLITLSVSLSHSHSVEYFSLRRGKGA